MRNKLLPTALIILFAIVLSQTYASAVPSADQGKSWTDLFAEVMRQKSAQAIGTAQLEPETVMIPMRDGTRLAADIYRSPLTIGKNPCIVIRTPYGRDIAAMGNIVQGLAVVGGYVCLVQDSRGTGDSEGDNWAFLDDGWGLLPERPNWDGYDTVEWAASQSWCNGKVGMFGASALGIAANFAAGAHPPHLLCAAIQVAAADIYHDAVHTGGGFRKSLVEGWLDSVGAASGALQMVREHEACDALWQNASPLGRSASITIPTYHLAGWYDIFSQGSIAYFAALQNQGAGNARGNQKILIGPWTHVGQASTTQGELIYPLNSIVELEEVSRVIDWFDYWLKGKKEEILDLPPVRYYLMGDVSVPGAPGNEWRQASNWPIPATPSALFLAPGELVAKALFSGQASYVYDPANPVPTLGGNNLYLSAGPYDQRSLESRPDVLIFSSQALSEPLEITGPVSVLLSVSSSALDTDWTAKLCDVYPDGRSMMMLDGLRRARFRQGFEEAVLLEPGQPVEVEIELGSTALVFNTGHRIRLTVSSSNSPRFEPNPNTGQPWSPEVEQEIQSATNTVYFNSGSKLMLPVVSPVSHPLFRSETTSEQAIMAY